VIAALLYFVAEQVFGTPEPPSPPQAQSAPALYSNDTRLRLLNQWYREYNDEYFDNKLPQAIIDVGLKSGDMATTTFPDFQFHISFDPHYVAAQRTGRITLLHEMCHVRTWAESVNKIDHGPRWRTCMLEIDQRGGFRNIIIDRYTEGIHEPVEIQ
jgi:hypothetical protein